MSHKDLLKKLNDSIENGVNNNIKTLKNKLNVVSSEIKNHNNDLVIQMKKINSINSQMVTSMSNYYTESETDGNKNLIDYLSDAKRTDTEFKIKFSDNKSDKSPQKSEKSLEKYNILNSATSSDDTILSVLNKLQIVKENIEKQISGEEITGEEIKQEYNSHTTPDINEEDVEEENISDNISDNISVREELILKHSEISEDTEESKINDELSIKSSKSSNSSKSSKSSRSSNSSKSIKLDNITVGSNASNKGKKMQLENKSVDTNKIMGLTKLNAITTYKKEELERIAKILSIPTTYEDGNKRKPYNKEELYSKIKDFINNKSK
jgi:hypothetical protein